MLSLDGVGSNISLLQHDALLQAGAKDNIIFWAFRNIYEMIHNAYCPVLHLSELIDALDSASVFDNFNAREQQCIFEFLRICMNLLASSNESLLNEISQDFVQHQTHYFYCQSCINTDEAGQAFL